MAENIILLFAFVALILAGFTSPLQYTAVTPSCQGLQSKHEFSNFSVGQRFSSGMCAELHEQNNSVLTLRYYYVHDFISAFF